MASWLRSFFEGALASPDSPVITLAGTELNVSVEVGDDWIIALEKGQPAEFATDAMPGTDITFEVGQISPAGDPRNRTFLIRLRPAEPAPNLRAGMSGTLTMEVIRRNVVLVPQQAVTNVNGQPMLLVVQNGEAIPRRVQIGLVSVDQAEIREGVRPGESIVAKGREGLGENDPFAPVRRIIQP
jgi:RND family efflux transporter MFP subunit